MIKRFGLKEGLISFIPPGIFYFLVAVILARSMWPYFYYVKSETIIVLGVFALWRYGWQMTNYVRSIIYALHRYPKLRRQVGAFPEENKYPKHIFFVIPSYNEEAWVSVEAFQSIMSNLATIPSDATLVVATGSDQDDAIIIAAYNAHPVRDKVKLILQRQSQGKRVAMGHALRAVAREYEPEPNSVTIFMDGDSYLENHTLNKTVPFFSVFKDLGALTTNEVAFINTASKWYKHWFNLKFGQRHVLFQSHALSNKVLTLTGRFSMFRTDIVVQEDFIRQIETDVITHWRHGKFRFLMGDDKSSWFYLLKHRWSMLYIPDVTSYSLESRDASFFSVSISLPYRWYGNTLRNNGRALALGWRTTGLFIWLAILDQRLSMWTSLVGISGAIVLSITKSFIYLPFYIAWVLFVRVIQMGMIALRGHPVSMLTIPLMLYNQWVGAFIKIRAYFHLSDQKWSKGTDRQSSDRNVAGIDHPLARWMPSYTMFLSYGIFIVAILLAEGAISMPGPGFFHGNGRETLVEARLYGVNPDDGYDDALALQDIIDRFPGGKRIVIQLPPGQLDFYRSVRLRSQLVLQGAGATRTLIVSHLRQPEHAVIAAVGAPGKSVARLSEDVKADDRHLRVADMRDIHEGDLLLLKMPNDADFLRQLGSQTWDRPHPYLRQTLVQVEGVQTDQIHLATPVGMFLDATDTRLVKVDPVSNFVLRDFSMHQRVDGVDPEAVRLVYENAYPEYAIDAISAQWASNCVIENVHIYNSGRHPLAFDNVYACHARRLVIAGAWNKGKKGHGYVRFARTYHSSLQESLIRDIRHITLQWSSAFNTLRLLQAGVDINFHGGYTHDNEVRDITFDIPLEHPWKGIVTTPPDARWAPPDGHNTVLGSP